MLAAVSTFALEGLAPRRVTVELDVRRGLPSFTIVGLGDRAVREARERVRAAIQNAGWAFPQQRVTVNLAPADLRKEGPGFDLAIACAILAAIGEVPPETLERTAIFGEVALSGALRPCRGALAVAEGARDAGLDRIVLPTALTAEAALVGGLAVCGAADLREVASILRDGAAGTSSPPVPARAGTRQPLDLADVRGQELPLRALTIAAAGGHHLLLNGPPGTGKTMLAQRLPGILPPLIDGEAVEVRRIASVVGIGDRAAAVERPFRAPHHTISAAGLVGGGTVPTAGEITLAHHGVLFLDEVAEFSRAALESLRQPLEDGRIAIVRGQRTSIFPARVQLVAAMNPCPCGYGGTPRCRCGEVDLERYSRRLSGPLLDRIDLMAAVARPTAEQLERPASANTGAVRDLVCAARERQYSRAGIPNARLRTAALGAAPLVPQAARAIRRAYEGGMISPRARDRVVRVAWTIADLAGRERIKADDVLEALSLRRELAMPEAVPA